MTSQASVPREPLVRPVGCSPDLQRRCGESERLAATLAERERVARELHDHAAATLGAVSLRLTTLSDRDDLPTDATDALLDLASQCREAMRECRDSIAGLRTVDEPDLTARLRSDLETFGRRSGLSTTFTCTCDLDVSDEASAQIVRIVGEALTNVRKHAHASHVALTIA